MTASLALTLSPASAGNLDSYIRTVNGLPMLSAEEEHDLGMRWKTREDLEAARALVVSHLRVVVHVSRGYLGYGLPQADLIQEGNVGLMKAVRRFDPERGVRLVSFAIHWIKAEIHEFILKNWRLVKVATTKAQRKLFFNLRSMRSSSQTLGEQEVESIAAELQVRKEDVREMELRMTGQDIPLESGNDDDEDSFAPIDYLADDGAEPSARLEENQFTALRSRGLEQALASLDERSRHIIEARWLKENASATLQDLADQYGVSAERIRQVEAKALKKMRTVMEEAAA